MYLRSVNSKDNNMSQTIENLSYAEAIAELEQLVERLQKPDCDVDALCAITARSVELIRICKERLTHVDKELEQLLENLDN